MNRECKLVLFPFLAHYICRCESWGIQGMYAGLRLSFELQRALGFGVIALGCQDLDWGYGLASWHSEVEGRNAKLVEEKNSKDLASSCISL